MTDAPPRTDTATALNEFFGPRVPGLLGVNFDSCTPDEVVGHIHVTDALIAGTGFLFAPAIVALADTLAAGGTGANLNHDGESFTTIELKTNFLGARRSARPWSGPRSRCIVARAPMCGTSPSRTCRLTA